MRYVIARFNEQQREMAYRIYITDSLKILSENSSNLAGGSRITTRFADIIKPQKTETRTATEVIDHIRQGLGRLSK